MTTGAWKVVGDDSSIQETTGEKFKGPRKVEAATAQSLSAEELGLEECVAEVRTVVLTIKPTVLAKSKSGKEAKAVAKTSELMIDLTADSCKATS